MASAGWGSTTWATPSCGETEGRAHFTADSNASDFVQSAQRSSCLASRHSAGRLLIHGLHSVGCRTVSETYTETEFEIQPDKVSAPIAPAIAWHFSGPRPRLMAALFARHCCQPTL